MNKILSQDEIDALLATVTRKPEEPAATAPGEPSEVQLYDFKHPERISKEQIRTLRTIHDGFSRMFATYLSTVLRSLVDVNLLSIDQVTFSEYMLSLSVPNALFILKSANMEGKALLEISPQFLLFVVDRMLGGVGDIETPSREITHIEQNVVLRVIQTIISQLNEVWKQVFPLNVELDGFEADPQFVQIARSSDTLAIIFFDVRVRGATFTMNLAFPYFTLEPFINKLTAQSMMALTSRKVKEGEVTGIEERVRASRLPVRVVLADTRMNVRDFMEIEKDDLLTLDKKTTDPLPVLVGGRLKYFATPGKRSRLKAVKILRAITPDEEMVYE
jgi:flagellar motor switch protein FliM